MSLEGSSAEQMPPGLSLVVFGSDAIVPAGQCSVVSGFYMLLSQVVVGLVLEKPLVLLIGVMVRDSWRFDKNPVLALPFDKKWREIGASFLLRFTARVRASDSFPLKIRGPRFLNLRALSFSLSCRQCSLDS